MSLVPALALARDASADQAVRERLERAADRVLEGGALARSMTAERALPSIAIQLIALGESSGQLGVMAGRAASLLQQSAERRMETVVRLVEPGLILFFGGLVGLVAAALLQAVYSLRPGAP
jgi:type II secretory pathway component PulF